MRHEDLKFMIGLNCLCNGNSLGNSIATGRADLGWERSVEDVGEVVTFSLLNFKIQIGKWPEGMVSPRGECAGWLLPQQ